MEGSRLTERKTPPALEEEVSKKTVILPIIKRARARPLRALFFLFLLAFFCYCVILTATHFFPDRRLSVSVLEFFLEQEFQVPK